MRGHNRNLEYARAIGQSIRNETGGIPLDGGPGEIIPTDKVDEIADEITAVVAEILQVWLDAGSERDVTLEEVGPTIRAHVLGWTYDDNAQ